MNKVALIFFLILSISTFAQDISMQNGTFNRCSGVFYDSGGNSGNYSSNESFVLTICPENAGQLMELDFTVFNTQLNVDVMTIYDGDDITAGSLGTFSGANSPGFVTATLGNPTGCLTIEFISDAGGIATGWAADISCFTPCQDIVAQLDASTPAQNGNGEILICVGGDVVFEGSATFSVDGTGATYEWDFGNSTTGTGQVVTATYSDPGIYVVDLLVTDTNPLGCSNINSISQVVRVSPEIDFTGTQATQNIICFGESTTIDGVADIAQFEDCAPEIFEQTWLEDTQSTGLPASYSSTITVDCYGAGQVITDVSQITDICVNIEHSFIGDLTIYLVAPNGAQVNFLEYGDGNDPGAYFGIPNQLDCDPTLPPPNPSCDPGTGWEYCFSPTAAQSINDIAVGGASVPIGTYAPLPTSSFNNLIGAPLNGNWTFVIIDLWQVDDGTLFSWNLNFDPSLVPPSNVVVSETWDTDASITNTIGNTITVQPATAGTHCYTYRATDDFGCEYTEEVCIEVLPEIVAEIPNDLFICDTGAPPYIFDLESNTPIVLASAVNPGDLVVTYYETQADADNDTNAIAGTGTYSGTDGQIIYIRVEYLTSDCYEALTFTLNVSGQPTIDPVMDLVVCDDTSNDGFEEFDLSVQDLGILGAQPNTDFVVTYHLSFADADGDTGALVSPYTNTVNPQPIYVRVESIGNSACYTASALPVFNLIVNYRALATQPSNMVVCDDASNDGVSQFNLSTQDMDILNGQDPLIFAVTYYETQADAEAGINVIANPGTYNNIVNPQTVHVRVEDALNPTCYGYSTFDLIVNSLPLVIVPTPLEACDDNADGFASFILTDKNVEILNGQMGINVTYYENQVDADAATNEVFSPYTNNVINVQTVYVRLEDTTTNCYNTTTLDLVVNPLPVAALPTPLEVCDDDNDGFASFDLTLKDTEVIGAQVGMSVTYHETQSDADTGVNALGSPYMNIVPLVQTVYVRLEDNLTGCYDSVELTLLVNLLPTIAVIDVYELCDDNNPGDEQEAFDLTNKDVEIINGQANVVVSYYATQVDADAGINALLSPYINTSNPQTIYLRLENVLTSCADTGTFELIVNPLPQLVVPTPLEVCDDGTPDGLTSIDLTLKNSEISGGNPDYSVTYYLSQADANAAVNPLAIPYTNISNPQTIYVRVQDITTSCYDTTTLDLIVEQAPIAFTPTPLEYCDPDSDGFGVFTLEDVENEITGGDLTLNVTYHETMADAGNNVNALVSPYNNIVANIQTIYVRVESATIATDCATIVELVLIINPTPQIVDPTPLEECDDASADGFAQFNLNSKDIEILDGLDPLQYLVTYYETQANADTANNEILNPLAYTNITTFNQILWVRVEDTANGCYMLTTLELIVNALPILVQPTPLELCDYNNPGDEQEAFTLEDSADEILNAQTGISLTYYETQLDANNATNPIASPYANTVNPQTIYVRAINDATGCVSTITLDLRVNPIPSPAVPMPLEECDEDNDGFAQFDLEARTLEIINGELDITITYHETQADADNAQNPLTSPYNNIVPDTQTVYARAENTNTGCYTVMELMLNVLPSPVVPLDIEDYVICDTNADGIVQFDLTTKDAEILGTQSTVDFILTYHLTQIDADTGNNAIANTTNFTNLSNPQIIYVRLESVSNGCVTTGTFEIRVELPPTAVQPTPLELCDDEIADEITVFDLTIKDNEIIGGNASWSVSYYETNVDAQTGTNPIPDATMYTNTSVNGAPANPQTLYVVVTDTDTGCTDFTTLTIRVLPNPTPSTDPDNIELCDDINTGDFQEVFDLTINEAYIINGEAGVTASYYETMIDAELGANAIVDPTMYTNIITPQTIYVRVVNDITGCYTIVTFDIIVNPLPDVEIVSDFIVCELNNDGFYDFDLITKNLEVLNGQDSIEFIVTYHESQADADNLINALVSPYTNITNPQQIFVAITNTITGCSISTQTFNIEVQEAAEANSDLVAIVFELCDDNMEIDGDSTNDRTEFDLTTQNANVLDGQDPVNYTVTYFETEADAELNINPLPFLYENINNPQLIYVRVDNDTPDGAGLDTSICYAIAELTLQVLPLPVFDFEDSYILCIDTNGTEVIGLPVIDTGLSEIDYSFEWSLDEEVIIGFTGSSYAPTQGGVYSVLVTNNTTGCQNTDDTLVIESGPPIVTAIVTSLAFADNNVIEATAIGNGVYEFSLDDGPWQESGVFENVSIGEHVITARDVNGCGISSAIVVVIDYPLYFTPNGDGFNETWNIVGIENQPNARIYIFDRYGKLLKQISPSGNGWNGTYNGNLLPTSDYWFTVEYDEPSNGTRKQFKAHFTLKR